MDRYDVYAIGKTCSCKEGFFIELEPRFLPALKALDGFGYINVIWWFSDFNNQEARSVLEANKPYKNGPDQVGVFATRSPVRPNPIALTTAQLIGIDHEKGVIQVGYVDARDNTPVLDIKPYTPSMDRVETPVVPEWCGHWPGSLEESASFPWEDEFNF